MSQRLRRLMIGLKTIPGSVIVGKATCPAYRVYGPVGVSDMGAVYRFTKGGVELRCGEKVAATFEAGP